MKFCPRCGVSLAESSSHCPLCGSAGVPGKPESADAGGVRYPEPPRHSEAPAGPGDELSASDRRRVAVELLSVAFGIALVVTLLVDLFVNRSLTWSRYASVSIAGAWLVGAMPLILYRRPWIVFAVLAPSLFLLVFLLDAFDGRLEWFLGYGLPIVACFEAALAAAAALVGVQKRKGLNVLAVVLCAAAFLCFGIETTVDLNRLGSLSYDWSVVVSLALIPTAAILFYLHYRIVNRASLRKLFRL